MPDRILREHFDQEAEGYNEDIKKIIPNYNLMIDVLMSVLPFSKGRKFKMVDLGCGTGVLSKTVRNSFPDAEVTCVDFAENMLKIAKSEINDAKCIQSDFESFEFPEKFDLIASSLAMHHLPNEKEKIKFYKKIHNALTDDGVFINIDPMRGADDRLHKIYMDKWIEFMNESFAQNEIEARWLTSHRKNDVLFKLTAHIDMLRACGFSSIDVPYKYYKYTVYTARK